MLVRLSLVPKYVCHLIIRLTAMLQGKKAYASCAAMALNRGASRFGEQDSKLSEKHGQVKRMSCAGNSAGILRVPLQRIEQTIVFNMCWICVYRMVQSLRTSCWISSMIHIVSMAGEISQKDTVAKPIYVWRVKPCLTTINSIDTGVMPHSPLYPTTPYRSRVAQSHRVVWTPITPAATGARADRKSTGVPLDHIATTLT